MNANQGNAKAEGGTQNTRATSPPQSPRAASRGIRVVLYPVSGRPFAVAAVTVVADQRRRSGNGQLVSIADAVVEF